MRGRRLRMLAAAAAVAVNLLVLYVPRTPSVPTGGFPVDKVVHLLAFAWPTYALVRAGLARRWAVLLMVVHAPLSEVIQWRLLGQRTGDPLDVLADLLGVGLGAWLAGPAPKSTRPADPSV